MYELYTGEIVVGLLLSGSVGVVVGFVLCAIFGTIPVECDHVPVSSVRLAVERQERERNNS